VPLKAKEITMQLIAIGDVLLNLDRITALDIDPSPAGPVVRVHSDSSQPIIEIVITQQTINGLFALVPPNLRLPGRE
jgi:hypothetical protein